MTRIARTLALVIIPLLASPAAAQFDVSEDKGPVLPDRHLYDNWQFRFEPSVWYVSPGGRFHLPGEPAGTEETWLNDVNLDSPRASPWGEFHLKTSDRWRFTLSAFAIDEGGRASIAEQPGFFGPLAYSPGDRLEASFSLASGEALAAWRLPLELGRRFADFEGRVELLGGARFVHVDLDFAAPSGGVSHEKLYLEPVIGMKANFEITQTFTIDLQNTFGYFNDGGDKRSVTWDIAAGFMYFPTENVGVQVGYRQLLVDLQDGQGADFFEYHGAAAGVYAGVAIRF